MNNNISQLERGTRYFNDISVLSGKQERGGLSISQILSELEGKEVFIYGLEGLSYTVDTPYVAFPWAIAAVLEKEFDSEAKIIHTGPRWQKANNIPQKVARQASDVRKEIFSAYNGEIGSSVQNISSDDVNGAVQNYEYLKQAFNQPDNTSVQNEFKERFGSAAQGTGRLKRQVGNISNGFTEDYTLHELAANIALIEDAKNNGLLPVKISFENQSADYIVQRVLGLDSYIIRLPLPKHPAGNVVPYSVPGNGDTNREEYILIGDSPETLRRKATAGFMSKGHNLAALTAIHSYLQGIPGPEGDEIYTATSNLGDILLDAAQKKGGYPLGEFVPAWKVFNTNRLCAK